jgi:TonB family protein
MAVEFRSLGGSRGASGETKERGRVQRAAPGPSVGLDDTLPPTPAGDLFSTSVLNVYVLAADPAVRDAVERACGDRYPLCSVADWHALVTAIEARRCDIAFIEVELLGDRLTKCVSELERHAGQVVTLVAADRSDAQDLIGLLSERKIHRLLIKPPAPGITRLLLESAATRVLQLRAAAGSAPLVPLVRAAPKSAAVRVPPWVLATGVAALVLGVAVTLGASSFRNLLPSTTSRATRADSPTTAPAVVPDRFADLIARAELAFNEGRLAEPPGDNALDYYLAVLAAEPTHEKARDRLPAVVDALFAQAENALLSGSLDAAATALANVRRAAPTSGRLVFLDAQLARVRADAAKAATRAAARANTATDLEARPSAAGAATSAARAELEQSLTAASARLRRGELIDPPGDSALDNVQRANELNAADPRVRRVHAELASALTASARAVLDAGDLDSGVRLVGAAQTLGAEDETLALLEQSVASARATRAAQLQGERIAAARTRIQAGALTAPASDNALSMLTAVETEAPGTPGLADAWRALVAALASNARAAIASGDWSAAEASVASLRTTGQAAAIADTLARELATARLQQEYLATAVRASELNLSSYAAPVYPADALRRQLEGWVDLEFVVDRTGQPRDLVVVQANPTGRFEQAALAAVAKYRYEPFSRDGQVYERRVRLRLRFNLK